MRTIAQFFGRAAATAILLLGLGATATAPAAILPDTIGYEGFLSDGAGPVTGLKDLTFRIYDQESGGTALWTEAHTDVQVTNGVFQVRLGSNVSLSDDTTGISFDRPLFVSVQVAGDDEMAPRLAFNMTPYSFAARLLDSEVSVTCNGDDGIGPILEQAAGTSALVIDISGNCVGNLFIDRDKVTIKSTDGTGTIIGVTPGDIDHGNAVIAISGAQGVVLENVDVVGASGDATGMHGIVLGDSGNLTVRNGSVVRDHNGNGIHVVETSSLDVGLSTVENNAGYGINLYSGSHADVTDASIVQGNGSTGINVALNSSLELRGSTVQGNAAHGISASFSSAVRVRETSAVQDNGTTGGNFHTGLTVNEGSTARVEDSSISTAMPTYSDGPAIMVYRGSTLRLRGSNSITAPTVTGPSVICPPDCSPGATVTIPDPVPEDSPYLSSGTYNTGGVALDVEINSNVRQDGGTTTIQGDVFAYNLSGIDLRDIQMTGLALTSGGLSSAVRLRDDSDPASGPPSLNGTLVIGGVSGEATVASGGNSRRAVINGNVFCKNEEADVASNIVFQNPATQGFINCEEAEADLAVTLTGPGSAVSNDPPAVLSYTVTLDNRADGTTTTPRAEVLGVRLEINVFAYDDGPNPSSLNGFNLDVGDLGSPECFQNGNQSIICNIDLLGPDEPLADRQGTFTVGIPSDASGGLDVHVNVSAHNPDPSYGNNSASVSTSVSAPGP